MIPFLRKLRTDLSRTRARRQARLRRQRAQATRRSFLEQLEDRRVMAALVVTTEADTVADDGLISLREAVQTANASHAADTITFANNVKAITFTDYIHFEEAGGGDTIIKGPVKLIPNRFFIDVQSGANVELSNVEITGATSGAISNIGGDLLIHDSTLHGNSSTANGGAVNSTGGHLIVVNSTISGNSARSGGGLWVEQGNATIVNSTVAFNSATDTGGGIQHRGSTVTLHSSIIAGNLRNGSASDLHGDVSTDSSKNLVGDSGSAGGLDTAKGNILGVSDVSTVIGPLTNVSHAKIAGHSVWTHLLQPNSPAIDAGDGSVFTDRMREIVWDLGFGSAVIGQFSRTSDDQRGNPRIDGCSIDMGALESVDPTLCVTNEGGYGPGSLAEAIELANNNKGADTIRFAPGVSTIRWGAEYKDSIFKETGPDNKTTVQGPVTINFSGNGYGLTVNEGVFAEFSQLEITGSKGTGIDNRGQLVVHASTIHNNDGTQVSTDEAGGITARAGRVTVVNSTIANNAGRGAGGVFVHPGAEAVVVNSTITGNSLLIPPLEDGGWRIAAAGGIFVAQRKDLPPVTGNLTIHNSIIAGNRSSLEADKYANEPKLYGLDLNGAIGVSVNPDSRNNLVGLANRSAEVATQATTLGLQQGINGNIVFVYEKGVREISNIIGTTLQDGGKGIKYFDFADGSPAINKGEIEVYTSNRFEDQRGLARVSGNGMDIGAIERQVPEDPQTNTITLAPFEFRTTGSWEQDGTKRSTGGQVQIGFIPEQGKAFQPLLRFTRGMTLDDSSKTLTTTGRITALMKDNPFDIMHGTKQTATGQPTNDAIVIPLADLTAGYRIDLQQAIGMRLTNDGRHVFTPFRMQLLQGTTPSIKLNGHMGFVVLGGAGFRMEADDFISVSPARATVTVNYSAATKVGASYPITLPDSHPTFNATAAGTRFTFTNAGIRLMDITKPEFGEFAFLPATNQATGRRHAEMLFDGGYAEIAFQADVAPFRILNGEVSINASGVARHLVLAGLDFSPDPDSDVHALSIDSDKNEIVIKGKYHVTNENNKHATTKLHIPHVVLSPPDDGWDRDSTLYIRNGVAQRFGFLINRNKREESPDFTFGNVSVTADSSQIVAVFQPGKPPSGDDPAIQPRFEVRGDKLIFEQRGQTASVKNTLTIEMKEDGEDAVFIENGGVARIAANILDARLLLGGRNVTFTPVNPGSLRVNYASVHEFVDPNLHLNLKVADDFVNTLGDRIWIEGLAQTEIRLNGSTETVTAYVNFGYSPKFHATIKRVIRSVPAAETSLHLADWTHNTFGYVLTTLMSNRGTYTYTTLNGIARGVGYSEQHPRDYLTVTKRTDKDGETFVWDGTYAVSLGENLLGVNGSVSSSETTYQLPASFNWNGKVNVNGVYLQHRDIKTEGQWESGLRLAVESFAPNTWRLSGSASVEIEQNVVPIQLSDSFFFQRLSWMPNLTVTVGKTDVEVAGINLSNAKISLTEQDLFGRVPFESGEVDFQVGDIPKTKATVTGSMRREGGGLVFNPGLTYELDVSELKPIVIQDIHFSQLTAKSTADGSFVFSGKGKFKNKGIDYVFGPGPDTNSLNLTNGVFELKGKGGGVFEPFESEFTVAGTIILTDSLVAPQSSGSGGEGETTGTLVTKEGEVTTINVGGTLLDLKLGGSYTNKDGTLTTTTGLVIKDGRVEEVSGSIENSFTVGGVEIKLEGGITYNLAEDTLELTGTATFGFETGTGASFTHKDAAGNSVEGISVTLEKLVIAKGQVTEIVAHVSTNFELFGIKLKVEKAGFSYTRETEEYRFFGSVGLSTPATMQKNDATGELEEGDSILKDIKLTLGTPDAPGGLVIKEGELESISGSLSGSLNLYGATVTAEDLGISYTRATNELQITGGLSVALAGYFTAKASLPGGGILIDLDTGKVQVKGLLLSVGGFKIGTLGINSIEFSYLVDDNDTVTIKGSGELSLPGGLTIGAGIEIRNNKLKAIEFKVAKDPGLPLGHPPVIYLNSIEGKLDNLDDLENFELTASVSATVGPSIMVFGESRSLAEVKGTFIYNHNGGSPIITLQGDVELAEGILGEGTAKLTIAVDPFSATLDGTLSLLPGGVFSGEVHLHIDNQANATFSGSIALKIPDEVPFVGGEELGRVSVEVQLRPHEAKENSWFKAEGTILIVSGFVKIDLTGKVEYEVKASPFGWPSIEGSFTLPGARDLDFLIPLAQGNLDGFAAHIDVTPPALTLGAAMVNADGTGAIAYTGSTQLPDATTIDLFVDTDDSGYNGHLLASGLQFAAGEQLFDWEDLASYAPIPYDPNQKLYVYGKIYDGTNLPVRSQYSAAITPPDFTPTITMPGERTFGVNQALVFSNQQQNAITVSDPLSDHDPDSQLVVELYVDRGILRLDPQQSTPWTNVEDPTDVDGSGGTDLRDAMELISMVNDTALLAARGQLPSQRSTLSNTPMYDVDGDGRLTASDAARMTDRLLGGTAEPSISVLDGVAVDGSGTRHLKLIGTADDINRALDGLTYQPYDNAFFEDRLEVDVNRYEQFFFGDTVSVSTLLIPRTLTAGTLDGIELLPASYEQGSGPANLLQDLQIESAASGHIVSGMITIEGFDRNNDVLDLPYRYQVALGIEAAFHAATGTLYLTGSRLIEDYQHAISLTTFSSHGTGQRTLRVQLADGASNVANTAVAVHIVAMNQAPIVTTGLGSTYVSGSTTAVRLLPSITVQDTEGATLQRAVITLDADSYVQGEDVLTYAAADNNITGRFNALTGQLELSGEASPAAWSAALSRVMYRNTLATATPGIRQINITVDDGNAMNSTGDAHQRLLVVAANTALQGVAVGNLPTQPATEINDDGSITLAPELTLTAGSQVIDSLVRVDVKFTDNFIAGSDFLSVDDHLLGMDSSYDAMHGVLTITGDVPLDWYEYVLRGVSYSNRSLLHDGVAREITFTLYDGFTESEPRSMTAQFAALPVVQAGMELLVYETGQSTHALDANINVMYVGAMLTGATVEFTWDYLADQDRLLFTNQNGISGSFDDANGVLTLTGTATVEQYQAALRSVQYTNTRTNPITSLKQLDVFVQDGETFSDPIYVLLVVDTEQVAPTVAATTTSIAFTEGNAPIVVAADLTINEHDEAHGSGRGTVYLTGATVVIDGYVPGEDVLTFDAFESEPDEDGDTLVIKGEYDVDDGVLFLFGRATPEQYQTVLRSVHYENVSAAPSTHSRVLDVSVSQGIASADAPPITVTVTSLNDPPTRIVAPPASATILENAISGSLGLGAMNYAPPSLQQPYVVLTVTRVPDETLGIVELSSESGEVVAAVGGVYTLDEMRSAVFVPALNSTGTGTFAFTVAGWNPILDQPDPAHLTESIRVNVVGVGPIAGTRVLDNFATDQNFVDGKYTFIQAFHSPANNPNVSGGVMNPNFAPGDIFATGTWLWNAGETLSAVGDKASVTVTVGSNATAGLFIDSDFNAGGVFHEARYDRNSGQFQGAWGNTFVGISAQPLLVEIELTNLGVGSADFSATISGSGVTTTTKSFTLAATSFHFGPVAFNANGSNVQIDNLTVRISDIGPGAAFVAQVFRDLLGRNATQEELDALDSKFVFAELSDQGLREDVVAAVRGSREYGQRVITEAYERLLGRAPTQAEIEPWLGTEKIVEDFTDGLLPSTLQLSDPDAAGSVEFRDGAVVFSDQFGSPFSLRTVDSNLLKQNFTAEVTVSIPSSELGFFGTADSPQSVDVVGNTAYVVYTNGVLRVLDVSNPANITELGFFDSRKYSNFVRVVGNKAYVGGTGDGLRVLDVSNPANIIQLGFFNWSGYWFALQVVGNTAYVAAGSEGLRVLDVSDPTNIRLLGFFETPAGYSSDVQVIGDIAYVTEQKTTIAESKSGLRVLNISDPANIRELDFFDTDQSMRLEVIDSTAYLADLLSGLRVLDVSNPASISELGFFNTGDYTLDVKVINRTAYVTGLAGFQVLDVSNPANISKFTSFGLAGRPNDWQFIGSTAYVAVGGDGLRVLDVPSVEERDKGAAFFGLETGDGLANKRLRVAPNQDSSVDVSSFIDSTSSGGAGTHRLQLRWNASNKTAVFAIDEDYTGGDFVANYTFHEVSANIDLQHLYFGSGAGTSFDDFAISFESPPNLDEVNNHILSSPEYFTTVGGGSFDTFVQAAFDDLVNREPTSTELDAAVSLLRSGTSRADIARQIEFSDEATGIVADQLFEDLLRRTGNRLETVDTARRIRDLGSQVVINGMVGSTEYYVRYGTQTSADSRSTEEIEATNAELIRHWLDGTPTVGNSQVTNDFDAVGTISTDGRAHAGGTLIAPQYVLTAAHLVDGKDINSLTFSVGLTSYGLEEVHVHPDYLRKFLGTEDGNDIAILKLNRPVVDVAPVSLWVGDLYVGDSLTLVGFGPHPGDDGFGTKRAGTTPIDGLTHNLVTWTYDGADETTTVPGDSGSPQFLKYGETYYVTSLTSGGTHQALSLGDFAYNTRVAAYADWINEVTAGAAPGLDSASSGGATFGGVSGGIHFVAFDSNQNVQLSGNDLLIQDISATGEDNLFYIGTTATEVVISDAYQKLTTSIAGATGNNSNTIRVPLSSFTGSIVVRGAGGDDVIDVTTPSRLVNIDAGGGRNSLIVNGYDADVAEEFFVRKSSTVAGSLEVAMPAATTGGPYTIRATGVRALELNTGSGNDTVRPQNLSGLTTPLDTFTLNLGDGNDTLDGVNSTTSMVADGGDGNDSLAGGKANDRLSGGFGDDSLAGGPGDDTYVFDADDFIGFDTVTENAGEGSDTLDFSPTHFTSVGIDLRKTDVEQSVTTNSNLILRLSDGIENVIGGSHGNAIIGDDGANILKGGDGLDFILGVGGADQIFGGGSVDTLQGSSEASIDGGDGADLTTFSGSAIAFPTNLLPVFRIAGKVPGTDYDQVRVSGDGRTVTLGGDLDVFFDNFTPQPGDKFTIVDLQAASSVSNGKFNHNGQPLSEGGSYSAHGNRFNISYVAGDGNDVSLTYVERLPYLTLSKAPGNSSLAENLTGLVVGQLLVDGQDPAARYQLSVADPRFEIVSGKLKLKQDNAVKLADGATFVVNVTAKEVASSGREATEPFTLSVSPNPRPWRNSAKAEDSSGDGHVAPIDALLIINELNDPTIRDAGGKLPETRAAGSTITYFDVNGDGFCAAIDVLQIINLLNDPTQGEGEATPAVPEPNRLGRQAFALGAGTQTSVIRPETVLSDRESLADKQSGPSGARSHAGVDRVLETWSEPDLPLVDRDDPDQLADDLLADDLLAEVCDAWHGNTP